MKIIEMAIPLFVGLILLEILINWRAGRKYYRLNDSISDLSTALIFSLTGILVAAGSLFVYALVGDHLSLQVLLGAPAIPSGNPFRAPGGGFGVQWNLLAAWAGVLIAVDFIYYWFHRATHQINFLWACHVTHHSSEEFNLSVALRQCSFQRVFEYAFNLPLAMAGVPWEMFLICHGSMKIYQFWVHTRLIGKLGFLERFMLTPSHHRVHHGRDPEYLDKNHGGLFIIWDKMFGTYAEEKAEPHYGLTKPLAVWNPVWANVHHYVHMFRDIGRTRKWADKLRILVKPPGWQPSELGPNRPPAPVPADYRKYDPPLSRRVTVYAFAQFLFMMGTALVVLKLGKPPRVNTLATYEIWGLVALGLYVMAGLAGVGGLMDGSKWALTLERGRNVILLFAAISLWVLGITAAPLLSAILSALAMVSLLWTFALKPAPPLNGDVSPAAAK